MFNYLLKCIPCPKKDRCFSDSSGTSLRSPKRRDKGVCLGSFASKLFALFVLIGGVQTSLADTNSNETYGSWGGMWNPTYVDDHLQNDGYIKCVICTYSEDGTDNGLTNERLGEWKTFSAGGNTNILYMNQKPMAEIASWVQNDGWNTNYYAIVANGENVNYAGLLKDYIVQYMTIYGTGYTGSEKTDNAAASQLNTINAYYLNKIELDKRENKNYDGSLKTTYVRTKSYNGSGKNQDFAAVFCLYPTQEVLEGSNGNVRVEWQMHGWYNSNDNQKYSGQKCWNFKFDGKKVMPDLDLKETVVVDKDGKFKISFTGQQAKTGKDQYVAKIDGVTIDSNTSVDKGTTYTIYVDPDTLNSKTVKLTYSGQRLSSYQIFKRSYDIIVPPMQKVRNIVVSTDQFKRKATLTWENSTDKGNGNCLYTVLLLDTLTNKLIKIADVTKDETSCTIDVPAFNTTYIPYFVFRDQSWDTSTWKSVSDLPKNFVSVGKAFEVTLNPLVGKLTATPYESSIKLDWTTYSMAYSSKEDGVVDPNYVFEIARRKVTTNKNDTYTYGEWSKIGELEISNGINETSKVTEKNRSYTDKNGLVAGCDAYDYRIKISLLTNNQERDTVIVLMDSLSEPAKLLGETYIKSLNVNKGLDTKGITLTWEMSFAGTSTPSYRVYRKLATDNKDWSKKDLIKDMGVTEGSVIKFTDENAEASNIYKYKVEALDLCNEQRVVISQAEDVGYFSKLGSVSGSIFYNGNVAVESARVDLFGENGERILYSASFDNGVGDGMGVITWSDDKDKFDDLFADKTFTIEFWSKPKRNENVLFDLNGVLSLYSDSLAGINLNVNGTKYEVGDTMTVGKFQHLALTCDGKGSYTLYRRIVENDTILAIKTIKAGVIAEAKDSMLMVLGGKTSDTLNAYYGNIDEFRIWNSVRTKTELAQNFGHKLTGKEKNLSLYWPFDEGVKGYYFDMSMQTGVSGDLSNGNHADIDLNNAPNVGDTDEDMPNSNVFGLYTWTNKYGRYEISSIPFGKYFIVPTKGVHEFDPNNKTVSIDKTEELQNQDFKDVSSFNVSGYVYYHNTNYPVDSVQIYVDGTLVCDADKNPIMTDKDGKFVVSVPIGDHFIAMKKNGHVFVKNGRYPESGNMTFEDEISGLMFYDSTLVSVAGRVCGGHIEADKPLGFGNGKNNIGTHNVTLSIGEGSPYSLSSVFNSETGMFEKGDTVVVKANNNYKIEKASAYRWKSNIVITPDPDNGEFFAMVPPLCYTATVNVPKESKLEEKDFENNNVLIDVRNPLQKTTDSLKIDGVKHEIEYNGSNVFKAILQPTIYVTDLSHEDGLFGETETSYYDKITDSDITVPLIDSTGYTMGVDEDNDGYPVFLTGEKYKFEIKVYEKYTNYENNTSDLVSYVGEIRIDNEMGAEQYVCAKDTVATDSTEFRAGEIVNLTSNYVELDSTGSVIYQWRCGFPNIVEDYTRKMDISITGTSNTYRITSYVFGNLPTGNNFISAGPDEVNMILRDPSGTGSSCSWTEGTTTVTSHSISKGQTFEGEIIFHPYLGSKLKTVSGSLVFAFEQEIDVHNNYEIGIQFNESYSSKNGTTTSVTATKEISTSSDFDYVGSEGDVFIGKATNIVYGGANNVGICLDKDSTYKVGTEFVITRGSTFKTAFSYTQNYIKGSLLPNILLNRNSLLTTVSSEKYASYKHMGVDEKLKSIVYVTELYPGDENFGEPGTYKMVAPDYVTYSDTVQWFNEQYKEWVKRLAENEEAKVNAIKNPTKYLKKNYSFDAGASITEEVETTKEKVNAKTYDFTETLVLGKEWGWIGNGTGIVTNIETKTSSTQNIEDEWTTGTTTKFSFTLADEGDDDAYTIDVYDAPDTRGPIFYTRAGQSSCPYEGETKTEFYEPGKHVIRQATMQIEKPEIKERSMSQENVPVGECAYFKLNLQNLTEKTAEDVNFILYCDPIANVTMPKVSVGNKSIVGKTPPLEVLVPCHESKLVTIEVCQSDKSVYDYMDIPIILASECQSDPTGVHDVISDTCFVSAKFVRSCTSTELAFDPTMNISTDGILKYDFTGYNINHEGFEELQLHFRQKGSNGWTFLKDDIVLKDSIKGPSHSCKLNMNGKTFPDGEWEFKAVSVCTSDNITTKQESEVYTLVKDLEKPKAMEIQPSDGILSVGDEISIIFNEDIRNGSIVDLTNVGVTGTLNGSEITHSNALNLTGADNPVSTEARIDLSDRSFSGDFWVNYTSAGTIVEHGTADNKFCIAVNEDGKMIVTIGKESYTSVHSIPSDKWCFVSYVYNHKDTANTFSAQYACGDETVLLLNNVKVASYDGDGRLSVGTNGFNGQMHQMSLWSVARDMKVSQNEMYTTKMPSDEGLIGYWKMEEGHGVSVKDYARARNMVMSSESWYTADKNLAAHLDGDTKIVLSTSKCPTRDKDDYMIETWFRSETKKASSLISFGEDSTKFLLGFNKEGQLIMLTSKDTSVISKNDNLDGVWHHLAMNIRRNGLASFYIDGKVANQIPVSNIPSVGGSIVMGEGFTGDIDEVRYWKATLTGESIAENMYERIDTATVKGLVAYYPFESNKYDLYNQRVCELSFEDYCDKDNKAVAKGVTESNTAPALKSAPMTKAIKFHSVADERKIVIKLDEDVYKMEGNTMKFTVTGVYDTHNNESDPIIWTAYINQATLIWSDDIQNIVTERGKSVKFSVDIINNGDKAEAWELSELPSWLTVDVVNGNLKAQSKKTLTFTIPESAAIGNYEETVYLSGNQNIKKPFVVNAKVIGTDPDWKVNPADYNTSMSVIARLKFEDTYSCDESDLVAAFVGDECVGVANVTYKERYDAYYVDLTVYGNDKLNDKAVTFKAWDASTGKTYPIVESSEAISFVPNSILGENVNPIMFTAVNSVEQNINLVKGWNWVSLYSDPEDKSLKSVIGTDKPVSIVKGQDEFAAPTADDWMGTSDSLEIGSMYMVYAEKETSLKVQGREVISENSPISVSKGWNWIGVNASYNIPLNNAFADLRPANGDMVKSNNQFATYDGYEWIGSLKNVVPGEGYMYNNKAVSSKSFKYPSKSATLRSGNSDAGKAEYYEPADIHLFSSNMTIIAKVKDSKAILSDVEVGAFVADECRGANTSIENDYVFLMVYADAESKDSLSLKVYTGGKEYQVTTKIAYSADGMLGTIEEPYIINIDDTGVDLIGSDLVKVYPNPADDVIYIDGVNAGVELEIVNMVGEMVKKTVFDGTSVNVAELGSGVYIVRAGSVSIARLIKK